MNIANIKADYKAVAHYVEDRLLQGAAFEKTVRDSFHEDEPLMRQFVRHCNLASLRCSFEKHRGYNYSDALLVFTGDIEKLRALTKDSKRSYVAPSEKFFKDVEDTLRMVHFMRGSGNIASAMLIEERISEEYLPRIHEVKDRNRLRGILIKHEYGL